MRKKMKRSRKINKIKEEIEEEKENTRKRRQWREEAEKEKKNSGWMLKRKKNIRLKKDRSG